MHAGRLILKLWRWAAPPDDAAREEPDEADYETRRMLDEVTALHKRRYYFALIKIIPSQVTDAPTKVLLRNLKIETHILSFLSLSCYII